ncbi:MAG: hypothetical protein FJ387_26250 [Verrucomicrobia bacterium]|nr:hypothetical protein [Verrucomicrobiota bacterium]
MNSTAIVLLAGGLWAAAPLTADVARLTTEHVDIKAVYQPNDATNKLAIAINDDDHRILYRSSEVALVVAEVAKLVLPGDYPPLGSAGDNLWILPQTQNPALLYLGLSAENDPPGVMPPGVFTGQLTLRLVAVDGPGHFFLWQADAIGGLDVRMNSRDGISEADRTPLALGSHEHFNYGFTTNGVYQVVLQVEGRRAGVATNDYSLATPIRFEVEPLPPAPATPFAAWQEKHWPGVTDEAIIGPEADPDRDRRPNRLEYAYAFDPKKPDGDGTPSLSLVARKTGRAAEITFRRNLAATDAVFRLEAGPSVVGPWTSITEVTGIEDRGGYELLTLREATPVESTAARFYRLPVELLDE